MTDKTYDNVKIEREGGVTFLVLNRPEKRNAMSPALHYDVEDALTRLDDDPQTKVLVLAGAGDAWCAGQDLKLYFRETANDPLERKRSNTASHHWRWEILTRFSKPTIAMVNGYCFGGAFTQLCACDFAIAAEDATFGLSEVNWGILPGGIVSWNLTDMLLPRHALYYAATGEPFDGKRAVEIGLVNFAVPKAQLRQKTLEMAARLSKLNPAVLRYTKEAVRMVRHMTAEEARDYLGAKQDCPAQGGQGDCRQGRHEEVPRREVLSPGSRTLPAPERVRRSGVLAFRSNQRRVHHFVSAHDLFGKVCDFSGSCFKRQARPASRLSHCLSGRKLRVSTSENIAALMAPRNVVLVGASEKNWSPRIWDNLIRFGFEGRVFPVNPNRTEIWGTRCYPSLADLPEAPDHLALFVPHEQTLAVLEAGGKLGARSASIYAAGFGEGGDATGRDRARRLRQCLRTSGIAAVGPNCMGLAVGRSKFCTFPG